MFVPQRVALYWLRRDFRLADNPALHSARAAATTIYAVYCSAEQDALNVRQRSFVNAGLRALRQNLDRLDASLTIIDGPPAAGLASTAMRLGATDVHCSRSFNATERAVETGVAQQLHPHSIALHCEDGGLVHDPAAIAQHKQGPGEGYRIFPPFYEVWRTLRVPRPLPASAPNGRDPQPGSIPDAPPGAGAPEATESAANETLARFVAGRAADYAANAEFPGRAATSLLAPYLRFGLISPRTLYHALAERLVRSWTLAEERIAIEAFIRRLALRDFFMHLAYYAPHMHEEALQEKMRGFPWSDDAGRLQAWRDGKTGYPLVDAAMRQLRLEGHVHQRAAVCAASFCACDLGLDWRSGRDVWMAELLAADEALCDGSWQRIAGIGSDQAAYPRIYNPLRQAQRFDPQGTYVRRYCTELAKLPTRAVLAPWDLGRQQQIELGFFTPQQYPAPLVDHESAAREFLAKYQHYRNRHSAG